MTDSVKKGSNSSYRSDLMIGAGFLVAGWMIAIYFDLFEIIHDFLHQYEQWQFDELLMAILMFALVSAWFSYRRWREVVRATEKARDAEAYANDIVGEMMVGLLVYHLEDPDDDRTLRLVRANPTASKFTGTDIDKLIGLTIDEAFPDIRTFDLPQKYANVVRTGEPVAIDEVEYGDERIEQSTFSVRAFVLPEQSVGVIFEDTSERSRAAKALQDSKERHEEAQVVAHLGHWELDLVEDNLIWSDENYRIFGGEPGHANTYETFLERVFPDDLDFVNSAYTDSVENRTPYDIEHRLLMADGSIKWVHERCQTFYNEDGTALRSIGTTQDITNRKLAELEIAESQERFQELVENIGEVFWVGSPDWQQIHYISPRYEKIWGLSCASLYVNPTQWLDAVVEEDKAGVCETIERCMKDGDDAILFPEYRIRHAGGSLRWIYARAFAVRNEDGEVVRVVGIADDITERKKAENELLESRARFSGIVEMAADAIISINAEQEIVLFNTAAEAMFECSELDVLGKHVEMLMPERFRNGHLEKVNTFQNDKERSLISRNRGMFGLRRTGEEFRMETSISKQVIDDNTIMTVMIRDITDQVNTQVEQRKLLKAIGEAGEAIIITDRNAVIEYVNPAFTTITGYQAEEAIGNTPAMLKSDAQDPRFYREMWKAISAGHVWRGTLIDRRKDGSFYPALMSVAPIHDESGEITHFTSLQQDMTEYNKLEEQFLQSQKMEAIGTLVGGIAHDFNNMLAALHGNIFLAKRKLDDAVLVGEKLEKMEGLSQRAAEIVSQLLTFARKDRVEMQPISLNEFLKEGLKLAQSAIPENIRFIKDITDEQITVKGDATQLQQVLMNLLNNARDAVADVDRPIIKTSMDSFEPTQEFRNKYPEVGNGPLIYLSVQDNGRGISSEMIDKVMEPFFTTKGVGQGTGLGLAMVYGSIQSHGGALEIESESGQGTTVHIYLPLIAEQQPELSEVDTESLAGQGESILLVDDDPMLIETVGEVLENLGYLVIKARDGEVALEYYREHQNEIDMVLSDVVMPVMGGLELVKGIRGLGSEMPVILMTGYDFSGKTEEVEQLNHCALLNKPVDLAKLSQLMRQMIRSA